MDEQGNDLGDPSHAVRSRRAARAFRDTTPRFAGIVRGGSPNIGSVRRCLNARKTRRSNDGTYGFLLPLTQLISRGRLNRQTACMTRMLFRWECCSRFVVTVEAGRFPRGHSSTHFRRLAITAKTLREQLPFGSLREERAGIATVDGRGMHWLSVLRTVVLLWLPTLI